MSSVDIDEIYEKLLQIYEVEYTNPKHVLHYRILELVREGRTREEAIIALYEEKAKLTPAEAEKLREAEEAIKRQISDYERSIERLTNLFSKGEISEETYKRAIRTIEKNIDELQKETPTPSPRIRPSRPSYPTYEEEPTALWYLVPLLFGIIGGIIAYVAVKDEDIGMAELLLWEGIIVTFIGIIAILAVYWYIFSTLF